MEYLRPVSYIVKCFIICPEFGKSFEYSDEYWTILNIVIDLICRHPNRLRYEGKKSGVGEDRGVNAVVWAGKYGGLMAEKQLLVVIGKILHMIELRGIVIESPISRE